MMYHTDDLVNVRDAARQCGRAAETVRRWIWDGKLPAQKLGNQLFIKKKDLAFFCGETATLEYRAEPETDYLDQAKELRGRLKARGYKPVDAAEAVRRMREERMNELDQRLHGQETPPAPGSKANLIKRMRKLRESIRARVGDLDAVGALEQLRQERMNEFKGLH
jgi:hypothetical protein